MIRLPEIKTAELSTYGNFAMCHQALFRVLREGLGTRLKVHVHSYNLKYTSWSSYKVPCVARARHRFCMSRKGKGCTFAIRLYKFYPAIQILSSYALGLRLCVSRKGGTRGGG